MANDVVENVEAHPARGPRRSAGEKKPAKRVGAVTIQDFPGVDDVAERLRHLATVLGHQVTEADDVLVSGAVELQNAFRHQGVEPAARLVDGFGDEVGREGALAFFDAATEVGVVAPLRERHRARVVPRVDDLGDACGLHAALGLGAGDRDLVDGRAMRVDVGDIAAGEGAELGQG